MVKHLKGFFLSAKPPGPRRNDIFVALADAQDDGAPPEESRKVVAERFGASEGQVREVEQADEWPPL
jgi:hypothetical protein